MYAREAVIQACEQAKAEILQAVNALHYQATPEFEEIRSLIGQTILPLVDKIMKQTVNIKDDIESEREPLAKVREAQQAALSLLAGQVDGHPGFQTLRQNARAVGMITDSTDSAISESHGFETESTNRVRAARSNIETSAHEGIATALGATERAVRHFAEGRNEIDAYEARL